MNPVFVLTSTPELKILAAKQLGIAYTHVHEAHIAYYFFNFARNQNLKPVIKQFAEEQITNPPCYQYLRETTEAKRLKIQAIERLSEFKRTTLNEYRNHSIDTDYHIQ